MAYQLKREQQLNCDISTAWPFFCSPHNLALLTPEDMKFTVLGDYKDQAIYEGMIINYTVAPIWGIRLRWQTRIMQVVPGKSFTDFQQQGPYKLWQHHHEFIPNDSGVLMKDTVDYEMPFGILGTWAQSLLIKKKLEHIFNYRYQVLEQLFHQAKDSV